MDVNNILVEAVRFGDLKTIKEIINTHGLDYSESWAMGYNLLVYSTKNNHSEITKFLLSKGARVNKNNNRRRNLIGSPLHFAAQNGQLEIVQMLLNKGANIHAKNKHGETPLQNSMYQNQLQVAEFLLNKGANVNENYNGLTLLHIAILKGNINAVEMLLKYKANVNIVTSNSYTNDGQTPLHLAAEGGEDRIVELLLQNGASIEAKAKGNLLTPIYFAALNRKEKVVETLLKYGADVDAHDTSGRTLLSLAVAIGEVKMVNHILQHGPCVKNKMNIRALQTAISCSNEKKYKCIMEQLLQYGFTLEPNINLLKIVIKKGYITTTKRDG